MTVWDAIMVNVRRLLSSGRTFTFNVADYLKLSKNTYIGLGLYNVWLWPTFEILKWASYDSKTLKAIS